MTIEGNNDSTFALYIYSYGNQWDKKTAPSFTDRAVSIIAIVGIILRFLLRVLLLQELQLREFLQRETQRTSLKNDEYA